MAITTRKLQVFLEVVAQASFRKAADALGISQPSVSTQIADLEAEIGVALFQRRSGATPGLTADGRAFVAKARKLVAAHLELRDVTASPKQPVSLRVAIGPSLLDLLRPGLAELIARHPRVAIEFLAVTHVGSMLQSIAEGSMDMAIYTGDLPPKSASRAEVICQTAYSVFGSEALSARLRDDEPIPLLMPPRDSWVTEWIEELLARAGVDAGNVVARSQFPDVLVRMAIDGVGATIMADDLVGRHTDAHALIPILPRIGVGYRVLLLGAKALRPECAPVVNFIREMVLARTVGQEI